MEKRYTALRIIATLYKIIGVILGILAILGAILTMVVRPAIDFGFGPFGLNLGFALVAGIAVLISGLLTALGIYAIGELISLLINIEENTRFTALIIRDRMQPPPAGQPAVQPPYQAPVQPPYQPPAQQSYQAPIQPPFQPPIPPQAQPPTNQVPPPYLPPQS